MPFRMAPRVHPRAVPIAAAAVAASPIASTVVSHGRVLLDPENGLLALHLGQYVGVALFAYALATGMRTRSLGLGLAPFQRVCLVLFLAVYAYGLVAVAPSLDFALRQTRALLPYVALGFGTAWLIAATGDGARRAMTVAMVLAMLLHLPAVALAAALADGAPGLIIATINTAFWHQRIWGIALAAALAALLGVMAEAGPGRRGAQATWTLVAAILAAALFWSGTRAGVAGLGAAAALSAAVFGRPVIRVLPLFCAGLLLGALIAFTLDSPASTFGIARETDATGDLGAADTFFAGRLTLWSVTWSQILQAPLFGHGFAQFGGFFRSIDIPVGGMHEHPHNALLQILYDFGLLGGIPLVVLLLSLFWTALRKTRAAPDSGRLGAMTALAALAAMSLLDGVLFHEMTQMLVCLCFGILLAPARPAPSAREAA